MLCKKFIACRRTEGFPERIGDIAMSLRERIKRYIIMLIGVFLIAFAVAVITKSSLGTSSISAIPYSLHLIFSNISYGTFVALFNMLLAVGQIAILRSKTNWLDIIQQLILSAIFGSVVDFSMWILTNLNPTMYALRVLTAFGGVVIMAFGVFLTLQGRVGTMSADGIARAINTIVKKDFGLVKMSTDVTYVVIAIILNVVFIHQLVSVREATVISALFTGPIITFFSQHLTAFARFILPENFREAESEEKNKEEISSHKISNTAEAVKGTGFVITIAREYGSGGREIGRQIAQELGIAYFDSQIISMMTQEGGYSAEEVEKQGESVNSAALAAFYSAYTGTTSDEDRSNIDKMFAVEQRVVREIAASGDCVIVGRLANWILRDRENTLNIFIRAMLEDKTSHVMQRDNMNKSAAQSQIIKVEHERREHCRYCTHTEWDDARNYDITMNTSTYGIDTTAHLLSEFAKVAREESETHKNQTTVTQ